MVGEVLLTLLAYDRGKSAEQEKRALSILPGAKRHPGLILALIFNHLLDAGNIALAESSVSIQCLLHLKSPSSREEVAEITSTVSSPYRAELEIERIRAQHEKDYGVPFEKVSKYLGIDEAHFWAPPSGNSS